jgi:hypothetical protein
LPAVPIAAFLAGALMTLLMPVALLIALSVWYWVFSARVPDAKGDSGPAGPVTPPLTGNPGPTVTENLPPEPKV